VASVQCGDHGPYALPPTARARLLRRSALGPFSVLVFKRVALVPVADAPCWVFVSIVQHAVRVDKLGGINSRLSTTR